ncbi:hypothetical protein [Halorubellus sp. PRR65]|uniref:hypothetical protein n=1 Tax=Halorubellus sp. PRR65 TaxID=3098148 RepID=UPI002B2585D4|nr:hypothetical protein [Halorubellus sp. PRR65]
MGGFDDLDQAVAEEDTDDTEDTEDSDPDVTAVSDSATDSSDMSESAATSTDVSSTGSDQADEMTEEDALDTPAFEFGETKQQQMYVRPAVWSDWEDLRKFEVERKLADRDIRNVEGRELDEAAIRVLLEHPEEVADYVEAARRDEL